MVPTEGLPHPFYLLAFTHNYGSASYRYAEVVTDESKFHVGVYSAVLGNNNPNPDVRNQTAVLVEIVEIKDFEATLEFVDASTMQTEIAASGHVALYGIQFNHDEATYKAESQSTVDEIAKALNADPTMMLYIVGHTDDAGALAYNNDLSKRRAAAVVEALVAAGIDAARLTPIGIGPVAPVGSNDSEEGRALNRRVELVKRQSRQ
jgi:outer membrane protein OmpA-like peptidoglycan-associated protein